MRTEFVTSASMKQRDAVTRRGSQRHATSVIGTRTPQLQQQQQSVKQESETTCVVTRQRKRRCDDTGEQEHLLELRTQTRRTRKQTQTCLDSKITTNNQPMSGDEEPREQVVETAAQKQNTEVSKKSSRKTEKTTASQVECEKEQTDKLMEAKSRTRRANEPRRTGFSNKRNRETQVKSGTVEQSHQQSEARTRARKSKEPQQILADTKNLAEIKTVSETKVSEEHLPETRTRKRREKQRTKTSETTARHQHSVGTVDGEACCLDGKTETTSSGEVESFCSEDNHEPDVVAQKTDTSVTKSTSLDTAEQTSRCKKSTMSEQPASEPNSTSYVSPECCPSLVDSTDSAAQTNVKDTTSCKVTEDDDETKWHNQRRSNLARSIDDAIILPVTCGSMQAELVLNRLESGSRGTCVRQSDGTWLTPNEFQLISGRGNAKDWKRSIRHHGHSLKSLVEQGLLSLASPPLCICQHCDIQVSYAKLVLL